jgi:hypothetical protein
VALIASSFYTLEGSLEARESLEALSGSHKEQPLATFQGADREGVNSRQAVPGSAPQVREVVHMLLTVRIQFAYYAEFPINR